MYTKAMKIVFLVPSLRAGGAERVASLLMNQWAESKQDVIAFTFDASKNDFYKLHKTIQRETIPPLDAPQDILGRLSLITKRLIVVRRLLRMHKPDIVVTFLDRPGLLAILASWGLNIPVVVSERTNPRFYNDGNVYDKIKRKLFPYAAMFVAQTQEVATWAKGFMKAERVVVIPNPVSGHFHPSSPDKRTPTIMSVGRLCMEKGFDMLIEAFSYVAPQYPEWTLTIVGGGPEEPLLRQKIAQYKLEKQVILTGESAHPETHLQTASIYVTSSRVEGFPNALLEGMAVGLPPISFDFSCGPRDIIRHEENGLLVRANDMRALAQSMAYLMENPGARLKLGQNAAKVRDMYALKHIADVWLKMLKDLVK